MSKFSQIWFSIFAIAPPLASLPFRCHSQTGWQRLARLDVWSFQVHRLDHPLALALKHDKLDERGHLVEPAEEHIGRMIGIGMPINQNKRPRPKAVSSDLLVARSQRRVWI
jgi:hypothetical protein